jgi:hypothetical protein
MTAHKLAPGRATLEKLPEPDGPSHQAKPGLKHPELILPPKLSKSNGQHPLPQNPAYQP